MRLAAGLLQKTYPTLMMPQFDRARRFATRRRSSPLSWLLGIALLACVLAALPGTAEAKRTSNDGAQVLDVRENEFVSLHVGYPGTAIVFLLRWDLNNIYVMPNTELSRYSRTYSDLSSLPGGSSSDMFCFGLECARTPFILSYSMPGANSMFHMDLSLTNYKGVLGMGPQSPIWTHFRYFSYSAQELILSHMPIGRLHTENSPIDCIAGSYVPMSLDSVHYWALIDMTTDYSFLPAWLVGAPPATNGVRTTSIQPKSHWKMELFDGRYSIRIDRALIHEATNDGVTVSTLRPITSKVMLNRAARVSALNELLPGWNGTDLVVLGRYFLSAGFTVSSDVLSGQTSLSLHWIHRPWLLRMDYRWFYAIFFSLLYMWIFVMQDSVDSVAANSNALKFGQLDKSLDTSTDATAFPVTFPSSLRTAERWSVTRTSHRNEDFVFSLAFVTQLACISLVCIIIYGYGGIHLFWRHHFNAHDKAAVYSALAMILVQAGAAPLVSSFPSTSVILVQNAMLLGVWLVSMVDRFSYCSVIFLILSSGWAATYAIQQFIDLMFNRMWPSIMYTSSYVRKLGWALLLGLMAAWWTWIFAFYTIPLVIGNWQPAHPSEWAFSLLCVAIVISTACRNISREFAVRSALRMTTTVAIHQTNIKLLELIRAKAAALKSSIAASSPSPTSTSSSSSPPSVMSSRRPQQASQ